MEYRSSDHKEVVSYKIKSQISNDIPEKVIIWRTWICHRTQQKTKMPSEVSLILVDFPHSTLLLFKDLDHPFVRLYLNHWKSAKEPWALPQVRTSGGRFHCNRQPPSQYQHKQPSSPPATEDRLGPPPVKRSVNVCFLIVLYNVVISYIQDLS